jgi:hypothetical protein
MPSLGGTSVVGCLFFVLFVPCKQGAGNQQPAFGLHETLLGRLECMGDMAVVRDCALCSSSWWTSCITNM